MDNKKKRKLAFWLALLVPIGTHKFVLGEAGKALLYILFCWTLIPVIMCWADAWNLATMSDEKFNRKY